MFKSAVTGFLHREWIHVRKESHPKTVFVLVKRKYEVYEHLGLIVRTINENLVIILYNGPGSRVIRFS